MLRLLKGLVLAGVSLFLSGCLVGEHGYIHNRKGAYLHSETLPTVRVPAGLQPVSAKPTYPIPNGKGFSQRTAASLLPPGNNGELTPAKQHHEAIDASKLEIGEGSNGFPVLKVPTDYQTAWKKIVNLLPKIGYGIIGSDDKTGIIEAKSTAENDQAAPIYQFSILQGHQVVLVSVLDQSGNAIDAKTSRTILAHLQDELGK